MNKRQVVSSLNNICEELVNHGFYHEANQITNVMMKIAGLRVKPNMGSSSGRGYIDQIFKIFDAASAWKNNPKFASEMNMALQKFETLKMQAANDDTLVGNDKAIIDQTINTYTMNLQNLSKDPNAVIVGG